MHMIGHVDIWVQCIFKAVAFEANENLSPNQKTYGNQTEVDNKHVDYEHKNLSPHTQYSIFVIRLK